MIIIPWFVINTDLTITTEKLVELFVTMDDKYVGLGGGVVLDELDKQLDLPESKVAGMTMNLHSPSQRIKAYLDLYATGHPCPNWRQVARVLRRGDLYRQAHTVESTYVQGTNQEYVSSTLDNTNVPTVCDSHRICNGLA